MTTLTIPNTMTVVRGADGKAIDIDLTSVPTVSLLQCFEYGIRQKLNDGAATPTTEVIDGKRVARDPAEVLADKIAGYEKRLKAFLDGTLGTVETGDPVAKEAKELAIDWMATKGGIKKGEARTWFKGRIWEEAIGAFVNDKYPDQADKIAALCDNILAKAKAVVAARSGGLDIDI